MIDYKAKGILIASYHYAGNWFVVLVKTGSEYVVSTYQNRAEEWVSGNYFDKLEGANDCFFAKSKEFSCWMQTA